MLKKLGIVVLLIFLGVGISGQVSAVEVNTQTLNKPYNVQEFSYFRITPKKEWIIQLLNNWNAIYKVHHSAIFARLTESQASEIYLQISKDDHMIFEQIHHTQFDNPDSYPSFADISTSIANVAVIEKDDRDQQITAIIIDNVYYDSLSSYLTRYIEDVTKYFYGVSFNIYQRNYSEFGSPEQVRLFFSQINANDGVNGAIILGELPFANFELPWGEIATLALFYEDLDGIFMDQDNDGIYDYHDWGSNEDVEMWTSWIRPPSDDPIGYLRSYFDKTHQYYINEDLLFDHAFLTVNEDWCGVQNSALGNAFNSTYGERWDFLGCGSPPDAYKDSFINLWTNNDYQALSIWAHSGHYGHFFDWDDSQSPGNYLSAQELGQLSNGPQMSFVWGCSAMNLSDRPENSLSTWYIMGENNGMSAIGTSRSIGLPGQEYLIENIQSAHSLGTLLFDYLNLVTSESYIASLYPDEVHTFVWDVIFVGNPYLFRHPDYQFFNYLPTVTH